MGIIGRETEARERRDPPYVDADPQRAWARGRKARADRETTEEGIAAAMDETRKPATPPGAWMGDIIGTASDAAGGKAMEE